MRLLSNLIKAHYISYDKEDKKIIDSDSRSEFFKPLSLARVEELPHGEEEGPLSEELFPEEEEVEEEISKRLSQALEEAESIKEAAREEAESLLEQALEEGKREGYEAGLAAAGEEIARQQQELLEQKEVCQREYEEQLLALEPAFAEIMAAYIENITGILVENKKAVILHLISTAIRRIKRSKNFVIRVSAADYANVDAKGLDLLKIAGAGVSLEVVEDRTMKQNQCIIEADDRIVDCSLDVMLEGLKEDIRILAEIPCN